jgi:hypothetical protein
LNDLLTQAWYQTNIRPIVREGKRGWSSTASCPERITARPDFNRWLIPPAALMVHLSIGEIYGLGIGYISPVSTLIKWFPDRPGLATGLALMGFGGGALIASPLSSMLLEAYAINPVDVIVPAFLTLGAAYLIWDDGRRVSREAARGGLAA